MPLSALRLKLIPRPYPFQSDGAAWLKGRRIALLADEMGLGKTRQAIDAAAELGLHHVLVVCPSSVTQNWRNELEKFAPHLAAHFRNGRSAVTSYEGLTNHLAGWTANEWQLVIFDESHYLKTPGANRTRAAFGAEGVARRAHRVWCLSATPAPNHAAELWPMLSAFGQTRLAFDDFVERYCTHFQVNRFRRQITGTRVDRIPEFRAMVSNVMLRRTKKEVLPDLPAITMSEIFVDPVELDIPDDIKTRLALELETVRASLEPFDFESPSDAREILAWLEGFAKSVSTLRRYTGVQKAVAIAPVIEQELADRVYDKVVLFAVHKHCVEILQNQFPYAAVITGETPQAKRQAQIDRFQNDPDCRVFIGNIQAAGVGITLTAASQLVLVEQDFVPSNNAQAMGRVHRIGQSSNVHIRTVSIPGTIDERVTRILARKSAELALIFDVGMN
jgi:SWI/SNF-related matrix-associated actin-dependent regulator 1 of chromatin subfamily A